MNNPFKYHGFRILTVFFNEPYREFHLREVCCEKVLILGIYDIHARYEIHDWGNYICEMFNFLNVCSII